MGSGVEIGIQRYALEDIKKPCDDSKERVKCHGPVNQISESLADCKTKVEKEESHFDDPVHPNI
jgi:hypothetical protein